MEESPKPFKFPCASTFVRDFLKGDRAALERVYLAYVDEVEAMVRRCLTAPRWHAAYGGFEDVRDLVQDVFIRAFSGSARQSFDSQRDFGPFLGTLTRNLLIDRMRRRGQELRMADLEAMIESHGDAGAAAGLDSETIIAIRQYLSELPTALRAVHEQRYVLGHPQNVTCSALGLTRQQLRTLEKRLRAGLERQLKSRALQPR